MCRLLIQALSCRLLTSILPVFLLLIAACDNDSQPQSTADQFDGTPCVLIGRLQALPGPGDALLTLSAAVDKKVEQSEPGMLLHTFDRDPNESPGFVWTEVCASSRVFKYHLQNPDLNAYLEAAGEITDAFSAALRCNAMYGTVSHPALAAMNAAGVPFEHFETRAGYIFDLTP